eukprot:Em0279g4a
MAHILWTLRSLLTSRNPINGAGGNDGLNSSFAWHLSQLSPVTEPTDWCAAMVLVPKKSGTVRICVDLNESVLREVHPLPTDDEILAQLTGATTFSMLDANCAKYHLQQIPSYSPHS